MTWKVKDVSCYADIALTLVTKHSDIILSSRSIQRALDNLTRNPKFFLSGGGLGFFGRLIYSCISLPL